jgi:uncharacterized membrane protein HdeD (DUF308 family)
VSDLSWAFIAAGLLGVALALIIIASITGRRPPVIAAIGITLLVAIEMLLGGKLL